MADTDKSKQQRPGEKPQGKFHYNPVGMSGKKAEGGKETCAEEAPDREASTDPDPEEAKNSGKFHYDPVGMAGKKAGICKDDAVDDEDDKNRR